MPKRHDNLFGGIAIFAALHAAVRFWITPGDRYSDMGFRVGRTLSP